MSKDMLRTAHLRNKREQQYALRPLAPVASLMSCNAEDATSEAPLATAYDRQATAQEVYDTLAQMYGSLDDDHRAAVIDEAEASAHPAAVLRRSFAQALLPKIKQHAKHKPTTVTSGISKADANIIGVEAARLGREWLAMLPRAGTSVFVASTQFGTMMRNYVLKGGPLPVHDDIHMLHALCLEFAAQRGIRMPVRPTAH